MTVTVTCEQGCRELLVARASEDEVARHAYRYAPTFTCFAFFSSDFRGGETARSLYRHFRNFLNGNFCSIRLSLQKFRNFLVKGSLFGKPTPGLPSELFSENQFPDYLGTFSIHFSHFRNIRNFCLDGSTRNRVINLPRLFPATASCRATVVNLKELLLN